MDGKPVDANVVAIQPDLYHVLLAGQSLRVRVDGARIEVNGVPIDASLKDPRALAATLQGGAAQGRYFLVAPMPGKVVRLLAQAGEAVEKDAGVLVIEAMKMQNHMKSPKSGRVVSIDVEEGATVTAGQVLAVIE